MLIVLTLASFAAAAVSGMIGAGGGSLLLALLLCFLTHAEAIPVHGAVQLVSNSTRTIVYLDAVDWPTVGRFALGAVPGLAAGLFVLIALGRVGAAEPWLKLLVGLYIIAAALWPLPAAGAGRPRDFVVLGLVAGAAALTVGAVGPLIGPLFARRGFVKHRLVATKALCQTLLHVTKIPAFLFARTYSNLGALGVAVVLMAAASIPGTLLGRRLLRYVTPEGFRRLYVAALLIAGLKVAIFDGVRRLVAG